MDLETTFSAANATAMSCWILLALFPRRHWSARVIGAVWVPALLAVAYAAFLVPNLAGSEAGSARSRRSVRSSRRPSCFSRAGSTTWRSTSSSAAGRCATRVVAWATSLAMLGETVCLWLQSARRTTSHFNDASAFDGVVFGAMGS